MDELVTLLKDIRDRLASIDERLGNPPRRWLSYDQAARYVGVSIDTIRRLVESKTVNGYRIVGGRVVIDRDELDAAIRSAPTGPRVYRRGRGAKRRD